LNFTVVPGCCVAGNPEPPNRELEPPKGLEAVLVAPNSPPLLVLVPKPEEHDGRRLFRADMRKTAGWRHLDIVFL